jgi:uncharacterized cupin superfamily protein
MDKSISVHVISELPVRTGTIYPAVFSNEIAGRSKVDLGHAFGLSQFGVNITILEPGAWSSHRHAHREEDELIFALEGDLVLVDDNGRHPFRPGMVAGFKAGNGNAHHLVNESDKPAKFLVVGTRSQTETVHYPDVDMLAVKVDGKFAVTRKNGAAF